MLRIDSKLHQELRDQALRSRRSLNQVCVERLKRSAGRRVYDRFLDSLPFKSLGLLRYGSSVRGEATAASDIDWLIVVPSDVIIDRELYAVIDSVKLPEKKISVHIAHLPASTDDFSNFWLELALEAEILVDTDGLVHKTLIHIRREIGAGRYRRYLTYGQPYWVKN